MAASGLGVTATQSTAATSPATAINIQDFLKILTTELSYQDPLEPMNNQEFVTQMAQFAALDQTRQTNVNIGSLLSIQSATQSVGLLGRTVDVSGATGTITGRVAALDFQSGEPLLSIATASSGTVGSVKLSQVIAVR